MRRGKAERRQALMQPTHAAMLQNYEELIAAISQAHEQAQHRAVQAINIALTLRNWVIGYHIVEYEQHGSDRAQYGERLLDTLTKDLRQRLGRGFGRRNLFLFREFYLRYPIVQSVIAQFGITLPSPPSVSLTSLSGPSVPQKWLLVRRRAASLAKYVKIMSAPARLMLSSASSITRSPSIHPNWAAALIIAYSPLTL